MSISGLDNLTTVAARPVPTARRAGGVGQVLLTAGRVGAGDELGSNRLPLRTTVPGIAAGHLPLRDGHDFLLGVLEGSASARGGCLWRRSGPIRVIPADEALEGRPAWVDPIRMVMIRVVIEVGTTVWAQPSAVIATQRAERKVQHDRGTHHGVKVDSLLGTNPTGILVGLLVGVEVQLLDVKEKFLLDGVQAARALPLQGGLDGPGREDPLSNRLQAEIKFEWRVLGNANHVDIEIRWSGYRPLNPDHLTHLPTQRMGLENETRKRVGVAMGGVHRKDPFDQWNTTRS